MRTSLRRERTDDCVACILSSPGVTHSVVLTFRDLKTPGGITSGSMNTIGITERPVGIAELRLPAFCEQCADLLPEFKGDLPKFYSTGLQLPICIVQGSTCPLCLYFASILHEQHSPAVVTRTTEFLFGYCHGPYTLNHMPDVLSATRLYISYYPNPSFIHRLLMPLPGTDTLRLRALKKHTVDYDMIKGWVAYCQSHHEHTCLHPISEASNIGVSIINLIDCLTYKVGPAPLHTKYIALSYVWGTASATTADAAPRTDPCSQALSNLPNTIEDAIKATVKLGYQYLWVDQCCLAQSDPHELQAQLSMMDQIYAQAALTIVAAAGCDSLYGLPGVSARPRKAYPTMKLNGLVWMAVPSDFKSQIPLSSWSTRAW
jgi:hypothetical protein